MLHLFTQETETMPTLQSKAETKRLQVHMPESLMQHIEKRTGPEGVYANASEFLRDLVRKDAQQEPSLEQHLDAVWQILMPGAIADESEFKPLNLNQILEANGLQE